MCMLPTPSFRVCVPKPTFAQRHPNHCAQKRESLLTFVPSLSRGYYHSLFLRDGVSRMRSCLFFVARIHFNLFSRIHGREACCAVRISAWFKKKKKGFHFAGGVSGIRGAAPSFLWPSSHSPFVSVTSRRHAHVTTQFRVRNGIHLSLRALFLLLTVRPSLYFALIQPFDLCFLCALPSLTRWSFAVPFLRFASSTSFHRLLPKLRTP